MPTGMPGNSMRGWLLTKIEEFFNKPKKGWEKYIAAFGVRDLHLTDILVGNIESGSILDETKDVDQATIWHLEVDWFGRSRTKDGAEKTKEERWIGRWWRGTTRNPGY